MRMITAVVCIVALSALMGCGPKKPVDVEPDPADTDLGVTDTDVKPVPIEAFGTGTGTGTGPTLEVCGSDAPKPEPTPEPEARSHTVVKGDTIWSLAVEYLGDGHRADEIVAANPTLKDMVNFLPVGKDIVIPAK